jgi:hypothetical protein
LRVVVDDDQRDEGEPAELGFEAALSFGFAETGHPFGGGGELDALAGQAGADRQGDREVGLAGPGRAEQQDVLAGVEEVELAEVLDHGLLEGALEAEVELLERFSGREAGSLDPGLAAVAVASRDLGAEQDLGEPLVAPGLLPRPLGQRRQRPCGGRRFQRAEQVREFRGLAHAGINAS